MSFVFKKAIREGVGYLLSLAGGTGSGKTFSALRIASGIAGDKPFALIDTENKRALHYADQFKFDHGELSSPFRPESYIEAIKSAADANYPVIDVDSVSHVYAGDGGILDWHEEELQRMAGDDWKKRQACAMAAWVKPKMGHKQFVNKLLQINAHVILCLRAEPKVEMVKENGKMVIVPKKSPIGLNGWMPVCEKSLPFEMTTSFLLMAENPGIPLPIKLQEQHKSIFPSGKLLDENCGKLIAEWVAGTKKKPNTSPNDDEKQLIKAKEFYTDICRKAELIGVEYKKLESLKSIEEIRTEYKRVQDKLNKQKVES